MWYQQGPRLHNKSHLFWLLSKTINPDSRLLSPAISYGLLVLHQGSIDLFRNINLNYLNTAFPWKDLKWMLLINYLSLLNTQTLIEEKCSTFIIQSNINSIFYVFFLYLLLMLVKLRKCLNTHLFQRQKNKQVGIDPL